MYAEYHLNKTIFSYLIKFFCVFSLPTRALRTCTCTLFNFADLKVLIFFYPSFIVRHMPGRVIHVGSYAPGPGCPGVATPPPFFLHKNYTIVKIKTIAWVRFLKTCRNTILEIQILGRIINTWCCFLIHDHKSATPPPLIS